ncbi:HAMP domain-containing sensor histidine kinase [Candidatus Venteria ishoeyi]|uniref:sensor histidine kinase n=1 Tax=Candidatus Venteria ishoeyi TaxID=1899563 RepID=UPI0025A55858|nr:HAMP domain-containing sensor histidine kinase [Candidatus Venteria ishoeyi]MDM8547044.1 HAMP domain-containing sensor histidine kinase [Candidatus Venteria ishoeyi]
MKKQLQAIVEARLFQNFIIGVILFSTLILGLETYPDIPENYSFLLQNLEYLILGIFVIEQVLRIGAHGARPWLYFKSPWNGFDFMIVVVCFLPNAQFVAVLRLMRILRILRLLAILHEAELEHHHHQELTQAYQKLEQNHAELNTLNQQLVQLNQDKNEFLGIAAHDLKNPLSAIKGLAEEIEEAYDDMSREEVVEYAGKITEASQKMFGLITNLLDVNAIESGNMQLNLETADILPVVQERAEHYAQRAKAKGIKVQFSADEAHYSTLIDVNSTHQVLDNLVSNAVKYSPHNKQIEVKLCHHQEKVRCEIHDQGPGLSLEDQQKLFGKFSRLSAKPTGGEHSTGLGLFIVKKLVETMHGQVWCESESGKGANFIIEFPKA